MKIIEQYLKSKTSNESECEDGLLVTEHFICLVDGATAKGKYRWENGKKSGLVAKELVLETVKNFKHNITSLQAIKQLTQVIREKYGNNFEHFLNTPEDRIEASVLIFSKHKNEIWSYGDCKVLLNHFEHQTDKKLDEINANARSLYNTILLKSGKTLTELQENDLGRKLIEPILANQALLANELGEYGYPVLNGIQFNKKLMKTFKVKKGDEIVFASDGYPFLKNTLKESEKALQNTLQKDPFLITIYKSTKGLMKGNVSYDDRAYIKFIIE